MSPDDNGRHSRPSTEVLDGGNGSFTATSTPSGSWILAKRPKEVIRGLRREGSLALYLRMRDDDVLFRNHGLMISMVLEKVFAGNKKRSVLPWLLKLQPFDWLDSNQQFS